MIFGLIHRSSKKKRKVRVYKRLMDWHEQEGDRIVEERRKNGKKRSLVLRKKAVKK